MRPCPFCGEVPSKDNTCSRQDGEYRSIYCDACGATGPLVWTGFGDSIHAKWNNRASVSHSATEYEAALSKIEDFIKEVKS